MPKQISPEKKKLDKSRYLYKKYGITVEDWDELSKNGCWICGRTEGRLNVDHRHVKGYKNFTPEAKSKEVRGALCFMCNTMLHGVEKRKRARHFLQRMIAYFKVYNMVGDEDETQKSN